MIDMAKPEAVKKKCQEFHIRPEWEELIEQKAQEKGYDYKAQYYASLVKEDIFDLTKNNITTQDAFFDNAPIVRPKQFLILTE